MDFVNSVKLSKLLDNPARYGNPSQVFGVDVDTESFTPPEFLKEIGVMYKTDEDGDLDEDVLDLIISYTLANVRVMLEIPAETDVLDASYLMSVAVNAGFNISLLPPVNPTEELNSNYIERLKVFTKVYLSQRNFAGEIYPITSYLQYMFMETFSDVSNFKPSDEYMIQKYVNTTTEEYSDSFKAEIRALIFDHFGGEKEFRNFAKAIYHRIYLQSENNCKDVVEQLKSQNQGTSTGDEENQAESA